MPRQSLEALQDLVVYQFRRPGSVLLLSAHDNILLHTPAVLTLISPCNRKPVHFRLRPWLIARSMDRCAVL